MQTLLEGDGLRDTCEHCASLQLPTVPRREGAAALTFTHVSIGHQREPWEAGAASPACRHRTLLTARTIFCKRQKYEQHDHNRVWIIHRYAPGTVIHSCLNSSSLCCSSAVLVIHCPVVSLPEAPTDPSHPRADHPSPQEGASHEPPHPTQQNQFSLFKSSIVLSQRGMSQELCPHIFSPTHSPLKPLWW